MNKSKEPQRFPVEPETVMAAYEILIKIAGTTTTPARVARCTL